MKALSASLPIGITLSALLLSSGLAYADNSRVRGGTLVCGGNHFSRLGATELHRTSYNLRNFSGNAKITIDSVKMYDADGNVLFSYPDNYLPDRAKTELGPHQTTQFSTGDVLGFDLNPADRPIQTHIRWSYMRGHRGMALNGSAVRTVRAIDGPERSRASSECMLLDSPR